MGKSVLHNPVKWDRYITVTGVFGTSIDKIINKYLLVVVNLILVGFMLSGQALPLRV